MTYIHQPYPAVRYHRAGHNVIVNSQAEHDELVAESPADWAHSPAAFASEPAEPEAPAAVEPEAPAAKKSRKK